KLSKLMAGKASLLQDAIYKSLTIDAGGIPSENQAAQPAVYEAHAPYGRISSLREQLNAFRKILIHDMDEKVFADIYAQTVVYGMFAARLADPSLDTFSRGEAMFLIPKSNPFLRQLFSYVAGPELDERIAWIVDSLADIFRACDIRKILDDFKKKSGQDPMIHFYETFLGEYNPKLRKSRGVYYTPEPVVKFIVRSVDEILKTEFGLDQGLADTSKVEISVENPHGKGKLKQTVHRVQILDPAVGTGTFLCEVVRQIHAKFANQQGIWNSYVDEHLIPRLHGFEFLMAPYAMCHLKLEMLLAETGHKPQKDQRLNVYLTNSLEEPHPDTQTLFASWLSHEAEEANRIKRDCPVMVVIGNPPYAVSSSNKGEWIQKLLDDYKKDLNEKNIQPLSDDYIKFIRFAEHFIEKNGQGIVAMITNNSFIDGLIHRQMRKHLLETFDKIYILNLHGNSNRNETALDGSKDENVFDIQQGVSINILLKTGKKKKSSLGRVFHSDLQGRRENKYEFLSFNSIQSLDWKDLKNKIPECFFVAKNFAEEKDYDKFMPLKDLFLESTVGLNTEFDEMAVKESLTEAEILLRDLKSLTEDEIVDKYHFKPSKRKKVKNAIVDVKKNNTVITKMVYRPFDIKSTLFTGVSNGIMGRPRGNIMRHMLSSQNLGLVSMRQYAANVPDYCYSFISRSIVDNRLFSSNKGYCSIFPLYLYPDADELTAGGKAAERVPNLNMEIVAKFAEKIGVRFEQRSADIPVRESKNDDACFTPENLLDYIYAVLHSPNYREKYKEFLKIDFPRIPLPDNADQFWEFAEKGCELRKLHLMESPELDKPITSYPIPGDNVVEKVTYKDGKVFINSTQYFDNVPEISWNFFIGGYQPAQKWLKDRKGRKLSYDDIVHYGKIIAALKRTAEVMGEIDKLKAF
ncbi:MAG TPA: N-6 DNA methylase, partial [Victivallales bacterium]|nr:N-6 DNA methylase [Victivallales bacterium]